METSLSMNMCSIGKDAKKEGREGGRAEGRKKRLMCLYETTQWGHRSTFPSFEGSDDDDDNNDDDDMMMVSFIY